MSTIPMRRMPTWLTSPWVLGIVAVLLYASTVRNQFALDDGLVLSDNSYVRQGVAGIPQILAHDSFHGAIGNSAYLTGGRYRPLSLVTYAVEVSLFGVAPGVHHLVNVLLFALNCVVLLRVLERWFFPTARWAAWCVALLFAFHPVHVEVVANIKGRDELLSLLFLLLTMHHALLHATWQRHRDHSTTKAPAKRKGPRAAAAPGAWSDVWATVFFVLALLSKENGLSFIVILPLALYYLGHRSMAQAIKGSLPVILLVLVYVGFRFLLMDARNNLVTEIMDNPYLHASTSEKIGTILWVHLRYLGLLIWPHPLSYDHSFNAIPYRSLADLLVLLSAAFHLGLLAFAFLTFRKRELIGFCILFYLCTLALVNNLLFNVGAPMAERFLYQASVPFLVVVLELIRRWSVRSPERTASLAWIGSASLFAVLALSAGKVVARSADWRTGDALFLHDVHVVPNSVRAQTFAGIALIHRCDSALTPAEKRTHASAAITHLKKAETLHPTYLPTLLNMGLAYYRLDSMALAESCWDRVRTLAPKDPKLLQLEAFLFDRYYRSGVAAGTARDYPKAIADMEHALKYGPTNANAWYDLGGIRYTAGDHAEARQAWERTLQLAPTHAQAQQGMAALSAAEQAAISP